MELQDQGVEVPVKSSQVRLSRAVEACWYTQGWKVGVCIFAGMPWPTSAEKELKTSFSVEHSIPWKLHKILDQFAGDTKGSMWFELRVCFVKFSGSQ